MLTRGFLREHASLLVSALLVCDILALVATSIASYQPVFPGQPLATRYVVAIIISVIAALVIFPRFRLYNAWRGVSQFQEFQSILLATSTLFLLLIVIVFLTKTSTQYSRFWTGCWYISSTVSICITHTLLRHLLAQMRKKGLNLRHVVILSEKGSGQEILRRTELMNASGFKIRGYFSDSEGRPAAMDQADFGNIDEGIRFLSENSVDQIWLAMPLSAEDRMRDILRALQHTTADIRLIPDLFSFRLINHSVSDLFGMPVINLSVSPMDGMNRILKELEDRILSFLILSLISPLMLLIAIGVKLSSPGPVFYRQERVSWNGGSFFMYKFRSMPVDAEAKTGAVWAKEGENRATPFGSFLRKTSLDELPQFFNVLFGDMSIVGPRPERPVFVEKFKHEIPGYMQKHLVKAGITGWAQINGWRGDTDLAKRIEYDLFYIENWSIGFDLKIIFLTIFRGFINKNAY
jgi:putative colanic acid biosynthesis UDP-glucose lipid carrier transferase